jgi:3-deoxy-D-manno-octulosonic-acid transferase
MLGGLLVAGFPAELDRSFCMIRFLYNLGLLAALAVSSPWWLWQMATARKYREGLRERLGSVPVRVKRRLLDAGDTRPVIWLHAVSVGEVLAVSRLIADLDRELSGFQVMISTTTRTGQELARERFGADRVFYCPLDLPWAVGSYLRALRPRLLILAETEFWPNLLSGCFSRSIPVAVVNARISDRSWPRYWRLRGLWRPWLQRLTAVLAQSEVDAARLRRLGCVLERVTVSGNLKFDVRAAEEAKATRLLRELAGDLRLVVAGSTLEGEEEMLLAAWMWLLAESADAHPDCRLAMVLAPRHPERFASVAALLDRSGFRWRLRSQWDASPIPLGAGEILLLDTIGELASVYSRAVVAFVGGSLVDAGGHNPLEPAQFGVPIIMGRNYANFRGIVDARLAEDALMLAESGSGAGNKELSGVIASLLTNRTAAQQMGERARRVFEAQAGATARTLEALRTILLQGSKA